MGSLEICNLNADIEKWKSQSKMLIKLLMLQ